MRKLILVLLTAISAGLIHPPLASADVTSDRAAAILVFPRVLVSRFQETATDFSSQVLTDTLFQVSNTSTEQVNLHCFYVNATGHCSISDFACDPASSNLSCPLPQDLCLPQWTETDFDINLTPRQPLGWRASTGLLRDDLPLDGRAFRGPRGESNAGTLVPPVKLRSVSVLPPDELSIFTGELKCIVVDGTGHAIPSNVVKGEATVITSESSAEPDLTHNDVFSAKYNGIGVLAIDGDANGDGVLELGGGANEYNGCPNALIVQHFFDGAEVGVSGRLNGVTSELTLVPCTQNFRSQIPGSTTAQFLVFNEFEQRFSTSVRVDCLFRKGLSQIDTTSTERSIFRVGTAGTFAGQTRIRGVNGGLLGVLTESYGLLKFIGGGYRSGDDSFNLGMQGDRDAPDLITLP